MKRFKDINECVDDTAECAIQAICVNTVGSYKCVCMDGFTGDGKTCNEVCTFNNPSLCKWTTKNQDGQPMWMLKAGKAGGSKTGPTADFSGTGYYILYDSSEKKFLYDEKATLTSHVISGPKSMAFYYYMYGQSVEALVVTAKIKNSGIQKIIWSRRGNQGKAWKKDCVFLKYSGVYEVSFKGTIGSDDSSSIALDDIHFYKDSRCKGSNKGSHNGLVDQSKSANCSFKETLCGWRNVVNKLPQDGLLWQLIGKRKPADSELKYIYTNAGNQSSLEKTKAYLISPRLFSPHCMALSYSITNINNTLEVVLFRMRNPSLFYKVWQSNNTKIGIRDAHITLPLPYSYQVLVIGTPSSHNDEDIMLLNVLFKKGLCERIYTNYGNCNFDKESSKSGMCLLWGIVKYWRRATVGNLRFKKEMQQINVKRNTSIVLNTSDIRHDDKAELLSPWMTGRRCFHFNYLMYGKSNILLAIYARELSTSKQKLLWVKSGNRGREWHTEELYFNSSVTYQFTVEGQKYQTGGYGIVALDNIMFTEAICKRKGLGFEDFQTSASHWANLDSWNIWCG